jgi:hypothetical protein
MAGLCFQKNGRALLPEKWRGFLSQKNSGAFSPRKMAGLFVLKNGGRFAPENTGVKCPQQLPVHIRRME